MKWFWPRSYHVAFDVLLVLVVGWSYAYQASWIGSYGWAFVFAAPLTIGFVLGHNIETRALHVALLGFFVLAALALLLFIGGLSGLPCLMTLMTIYFAAVKIGVCSSVPLRAASSSPAGVRSPRDS